MPLHTDILDHIKVAVVVVDTSFEVQYLNPAAEDFCCGSDEYFHGRKLQDLFTGDEVSPDTLRRCFGDYEIYTMREATVTVAATGHRSCANVAVSPISDSQLLIEIEPLDRILSISKVNEMRSAQVASQQLVRGLAHEIKNPLGGIRGAAQLLQQELSGPDQTQYTDVIISETDRLRSLVDRLLGPNQSPCFTAVNVHEVLEQVLLVTKPDQPPELDIRRFYDPSLPAIHGDYDQLIQATLNIVRNAHDALSEVENPVLTIRTRIEHQYTIGDTRHNMVGHLRITDNGSGVPTAIQNQIFLPLVTGKSQGTGLGLAITQTIVGVHRGLITCESRPGQTSFDIFLPLALATTRKAI